MSLAEMDTAAVIADRGVYATRRASCGCRGVPDGQHVADACGFGGGDLWLTEAEECVACGYRSKTEAGRCGICGARR